MPWFVRMITKRLRLHVKKFMADAGYDGYRVRLLVIRKLKAIPFITLNPRNCEGGTHEEKMKRCRLLRYRWHAKNFLKKFWADPASEKFDKEFDSRTFSEQGFSVGKGSLNLGALKGKGKPINEKDDATIQKAIDSLSSASVKLSDVRSRTGYNFPHLGVYKQDTPEGGRRDNQDALRARGHPNLGWREATGAQENPPAAAHPAEARVGRRVE